MFTPLRAAAILAVLSLITFPAPAQTRPKAPAVATAPAAAPIVNGKFPTYPADLKFDPGKEVKVDDPQTVKAGLEPTDADPTNHFVVYIPKDYDAARSYPVIINYHGLGSEPTTWPFKGQTDGKGYIIIGMEYLRPACYKADAAYELGYIKRMITWLKANNVNVDTKMIYIAGFSQGGWHVAGLCDKLADTIAGIIISSAGRSATGPKVAAYAKMPVLITAGETDGNRSSAETGATYFKSQGADVTLEIFKGKGHEIDTGSAIMKQWLKDNGPVRAAKVNFAAADKAKKDGQLGAAYTLYAAIGKNPDSGDFKDKADAAATELSTAAQKKIDEAEALITARKYPEAKRAFALLVTPYAGSTFADAAKKRMEFIDKDPTIAADSAQAAIDGRADVLESQAQSAETKKDYAGALLLYENYIKTYPKSHHFEAVQKHLADLKADKSVTAGAAAQLADRDARENFDAASNYVAKGTPEKARPLLEEIIKKYPDTEWATKAKTLLATLK